MADDAAYGTDVRMLFGATAPDGKRYTVDLDPYFGEIDGADAVAQNVALRCLTPRAPAPGHLIGAEGDGVFLPDFLQGKLDARSLFVAKTLIEGEAIKDERVDDVRVTTSADLASQTAEIRITGITSDQEPFSLTLNATQGEVTVAALNEEG
jgi:hypothetical protein